MLRSMLRAAYRRVPHVPGTVSSAKRDIQASLLRRPFGSASARDDEQEAMHQAIRESVQALCKQYPGEYWRELERRPHGESRYPAEFVEHMQRDGLLSILIPEEYGGGGQSLRTACVVLEEVHRAGCNAAAAHAQMYTMGSLLHSGSDEQKEEWLPKVASGELRLQAFGVSEPNSGTDTLSLETVAVKDGDDYVINGQKMWTSRAEYSDAMLLLARTDFPEPPREDGRARAKALTLFVVDMRDKVNCGNGIEISPVETMMNHSTTTIFFDNLRVPAKNIIGGEGNGFKTVLGAMNAERVLIAAECIGDGRFFIDRATQYAKDRNVFGRPIGANQGIAFPIAEAYAEIEAAALMVNHAADLIDGGATAGEQANLAKYLAAEASWQAGDVCLQTHGGYGFATEFDIERKWRETRLYRVAPISTNLVMSFVAQNVLGLPRSY